MSPDILKPQFWLNRAIDSFSEAEWEALCDGCGQCCLQKVEDLDTGNYSCTNISCHLLNEKTARCSHYLGRQHIVPDCEKITPENAGSLPWLPTTCAYRLVAYGKDLPAWHPLKTGRRDSVQKAGVSVIGRTISEARYATTQDKQGLQAAGDIAVQAWLASDSRPIWVQDKDGNLVINHNLDEVL